MRINILKLIFEFKYPTIYDYQHVKTFINLVSRANVRINMEEITCYKTYNESDHSNSHIIIYNEPEKIMKQLDTKIEETYKKNKIIFVYSNYK